MAKLLDGTGKEIPTSSKTSNVDAIRIRQACKKFRVPEFAEDLIREGLSFSEAWDRLVQIDTAVQ